jgi:hypothetical protein
MNKFIVILSDRDEAHLRLMFESVVRCLRENEPRKFVPLLPYIVLFEFDGDKEAAYTVLAKRLGPADHAILIQIHPGYCGQANLETALSLGKFFGVDVQR